MFIDFRAKEGEGESQIEIKIQNRKGQYIRVFEGRSF